MRATLCVVLRFMAAILTATTLALAAPAPSKAEGHRYVVAAIGDSLTDTRVGGGRYLDTLRRKCPESRFDAYGVGGQQTLHMRWRFGRDVLGIGAKRPRYTDVIILGGVNDLTARSPFYADTTRIRENLTNMYKKAHARGIRVIALTIPPWGRLKGFRDRRAEATFELNRWISAQEKMGAVDVVVDIRPLLSCGDELNLCPEYRRYPNDRIHWGRAGHDVVGDALHQNAFSDCR